MCACCLCAFCHRPAQREKERFIFLSIDSYFDHQCSLTAGLIKYSIWSIANLVYAGSLLLFHSCWV